MRGKEGHQKARRLTKWRRPCVCRGRRLHKFRLRLGRRAKRIRNWQRRCVCRFRSLLKVHLRFRRRTKRIRNWQRHCGGRSRRLRRVHLRLRGRAKRIQNWQRPCDGHSRRSPAGLAGRRIGQGVWRRSGRGQGQKSGRVREARHPWWNHPRRFLARQCQQQRDRPRRQGDGRTTPGNARDARRRIAYGRTPWRARPRRTLKRRVVQRAMHLPRHLLQMPRPAHSRSAVDRPCGIEALQ